MLGRIKDTLTRAPLIEAMLAQASSVGAARVSATVQPLIDDLKQQRDYLAQELERANSQAAGPSAQMSPVPAAAGGGTPDGDPSRPPPWMQQIVRDEVRRALSEIAPEPGAPTAQVAPRTTYYRPPMPAAGGGPFPFRSFLK